MIIFWIYLAKYKNDFHLVFLPTFFFHCGLLKIFNLHEQITLYFCWTVGIQRPSQSWYSHPSGDWWGIVLWGPVLMPPFLPSSLPSPQFLKPIASCLFLGWVIPFSQSCAVTQSRDLGGQRRKDSLTTAVRKETCPCDSYRGLAHSGRRARKADRQPPKTACSTPCWACLLCVFC